MGVSSYPSTYCIRINVGDVPSIHESFDSTGDKDYASIVSTVQYVATNSGIPAYFIVTFSGLPFGTGNYEVLTSCKSLRGSASGLDNDIATPVYF